MAQGKPEVIVKRKRPHTGRYQGEVWGRGVVWYQQALYKWSPNNNGGEPGNFYPAVLNPVIVNRPTPEAVTINNKS